MALQGERGKVSLCYTHTLGRLRDDLLDSFETHQGALASQQLAIWHLKWLQFPVFADEYLLRLNESKEQKKHYCLTNSKVNRR